MFYIGETMEWYFRLIHGLPPRNITDDLDRFKKTFPEFAENTNNFPMHFPFIPGRIHEDWIKKRHSDAKNINDQIKYSCPLGECRLKTEDQITTNPSDSNNIIHLVVGPKGNFSETSSIDDFVTNILSKLKDENETTQFEKAFYVDPYLFKSCFPKSEKNNNSEEFSKKFVNEISKALGENCNVNIVSTFRDCKFSTLGEISKYLNTVSCHSIEESIFHDRFLICKNEESYSGVQIGTSVNSIKGQRHYLISNISSDDSNVLWSIVTGYI